nr:hypothetical protein [uncultured Carboxylicivirga sp.]
MRKITSHYSLKPDGTWAKRSVIEVDDGGFITSIREMGDDFVEEPNLEYFPGIIIPSFVMDVKSELTDKQTILKSISVGTRRFILDRLQNLPNNVQSIVSDNINSESVLIPWQSLLEDNMLGIPLAKALQKYTVNKASKYKIEDTWGAIKVGSNPGLILLQGVDLKTFSLTSKVSMRVLVD